MQRPCLGQQAPTFYRPIDWEWLSLSRPFMEWSGCLAVRAGSGTIDMHARGHVKCASKYNRLSRVEDRDLIQKATSLHRDNASKVFDIIWVLQPMAYEICTWLMIVWLISLGR